MKPSLIVRCFIWAWPDHEAQKRPLPFDAGHPFRNLGARAVRVAPGQPPGPAAVGIEEIELTLQERSGTEGFQQLLRPSTL